MSSIRRGRHGYYFFDIRLEDGTRVRETLKTKDKNIAKMKARTRESELLNQPRYERTTCDDFFKEFLLWAEARRSHGTILNYQSIIKRLKKGIPVKHLDDITPEKANTFISSLIDDMTGRGVNYYLRALRAIFNVAKNDFKCIAINPFESVKKVKEASIRPRRLSKGEILKLFQAFQELLPEYYPLFLFYLLTGMRRSEALQLEWDDIDFDGSCIIVHGKGDKYRIVPMLPLVREILLNRKKLTKPFDWDGSTITHKFVWVRKKLGMKKVKLHDLRKTFGTLLADRGVSEYFIQQWLGHSDASVTKMYYIGAHDSGTKKLLEDFGNDVAQSLPKQLTETNEPVRRSK